MCVSLRSDKSFSRMTHLKSLFDCIVLWDTWTSFTVSSTFEWISNGFSSTVKLSYYSVSALTYFFLCFALNWIAGGEIPEHLLFLKKNIHLFYEIVTIFIVFCFPLSHRRYVYMAINCYSQYCWILRQYFVFSKKSCSSRVWGSSRNVKPHTDRWHDLGYARLCLT